jgi:hypothetical protein
MKALRLDSKNLYAANGLTILLAEAGHLDLAKEYMLQIREACGDLPEVRKNQTSIFQFCLSFLKGLGKFGAHLSCPRAVRQCYLNVRKRPEKILQQTEHSRSSLPLQGAQSCLSLVP